jgi:ribosomal protein S3
LTTTLTLFVKYLDPQPLADHLAKIIGATKKHASTLKLIKTVLRTLHFKRGVGYRIALIGRINGANKSRTIYLKKLNRNRPRQTFSKNVNFAMSQARATIGAFGVKI